MTENIFPARQLGAGDTWGREVESRIRALSRELTIERQKTANLTRGSNTQAATVAQLSSSIEILLRQLEEQSGGGANMADQINENARNIGVLFDRLPVSRGDTSTFSGVSIATGGALFGATSITVPSRKRRAVVSLVLSASLHKPSTASLSTQLVINGVPVETPRNLTALSGRQEITLSYSTEMIVEPGQVMTFQAKFTTDTAIPNPSTASPNIIVLTTNVVFSN